ncbi:MAG TPA: substrate-binding domain-containing protein, partial [Lachnospiraceae bacterium]|nr:substrate-binding domain-containing protein [Lachnospiraceae bacterium]
TTGWSYEFIFEVLGGIKDAVKDDEVDLYLFLCYGYYDETSAFNHGEYNIFNLIHYEDFDGVILFSNIFNSLAVLEREKNRILQSKTPVVSLEYKLDGVDYIGTDNYSGMHEIVEHLVQDHGLRDIAYISGPDDNYESRERGRAFLEVMRENNIEPKENRVVLHGNWSYEFAYSATTNLVKDRKNMPEAIVCVNDEGAIAAITCLYKLGINVPREVKVVGFDDMKSAAIITPAISTVNRNWKGLGKRTIAHLNKLMNGEAVEHEEVIQSIAVKRASCGCKVAISEEYTNDRLDLFYQQKMGLNFNKNQRHLEEVFMEIDDPKALLDTVREFFLDNPFFSDTDFSIMIEKESVPQEINFEELWIRTEGYSDQLLNAIHIEDGELQPITEIKTRQLLPESMFSDNNDIFLFVPFHFQGQVLGYFVGKNAMGLIKIGIVMIGARVSAADMQDFARRELIY